MPLTFGSLFAGIGGFDLGFERAEMTCKWQVEIDPFCQRVLAKHWPDVERFSDVREFATEAEIDRLRVDVICGGFPCQDISLAGRGAGIDGERSGLWAEFARIVRVVRPRYVVVENSPALLGRGMGRVVGDLAACGYDAEWDCLPAAAFGAPHLRDRLFIVAHANGERREEQHVPALAARAGQHHRAHHADGPDARVFRPPLRGERPHLSGPNRRRGDDGRRGRSDSRQERSVATGQATTVGTDTTGGREGQLWRVECPEDREGEWSLYRAGAEPPVPRVAHGVPDRPHRLAGAGNAVVPQVAEWIGRRILEADGVTT